MGVVGIAYYFSHSLARFDSNLASFSGAPVYMDENTEFESMRVATHWVRVYVKQV